MGLSTHMQGGRPVSILLRALLQFPWKVAQYSGLLNYPPLLFNFPVLRYVALLTEFDIRKRAILPSVAIDFRYNTVLKRASLRRLFGVQLRLGAPIPPYERDFNHEIPSPPA